MTAGQSTAPAPSVRATSTTGRIRVYVAGAPDAPLTIAALEALARNPMADLVGIDFGRMDPERLRAAAPDLLLSAAHEHVIRDPELRVARLGSIGLHPGLLPKYRGSHPLWWALRNREAEVGLTLYVLDDGIDSGPVIAQTTISTEPGDTFGSLYRRVAQQVAPMLNALLEAIAEADALPRATPQDHSRASVYHPPTHRQLHGTLVERAARKAVRTVRALMWRGPKRR